MRELLHNCVSDNAVSSKVAFNFLGRYRGFNRDPWRLTRSHTPPITNECSGLDIYVPGAECQSSN